MKSQKTKSTRSQRSTTKSGRSYTSSYRGDKQSVKPLHWDAERKRIMESAQSRIDNKPAPRLPYSNLLRPQLFEEIGDVNKTLHFGNVQTVNKILLIHHNGGRTKPFMKDLGVPKTNYNSRRDKAKTLEVDNEVFYEELKAVGPKVEKVRELNKEWKETQRLISSRSKYPLHWVPTTKLTDKVCGKRAVEITQLVTSKSAKYPDKRPRVVIEISHEIFGVVGRMTAMLYSDYVPKTCQNFLAFCQKSDLGSYEGCEIFRIFPKFYCVTGDVIYNTGLGGNTYCGTYIENENFLIKPVEPGVLCTHNVQENKNTSQFLITFRPLPPIAERFVGFGKIIEGLNLIMEIESYGTHKSGYPKKKLWISKITEV